jgi:penicillin-binding protein 1B
VSNVRAGETVQGGSTISQQLVKNLLGPGPRTWSRKAVEAAGALTLEWRRSKDEILEAYLNEAYLGQRGPVAISGVGDASRFFFGIDVAEIDLARSALLAGIIQSPGRYNPWLHPQEAKGRRDHVLGLLRESKVIDDETYRRTVALGLGVARDPVGAKRMPWIEDVLAEEIRSVSPEALPSSAGFSIFTTFDPEVQRAAEAALAQGLDRLREGRKKNDPSPLEGALIVLRPSDGALLALVGGRDYQHSQFNRATDSRRPAGSTFKPFVYLAALERTEREPEFAFTAATQLEDTPLEVRSGGRLWSPENYDHTFREVVTVREALENSINVPTVRAAMRVGLPAVVDAARRCGIRSDLAAVPALALGAEAVSPLELAAAYAPFANGGWRVQPHSLAGVLDRDGASLGTFDAPRVRAIDARASYLMTHLLEGVLTRGTGRSAAALGFTGHAAGKTGTSNDERDAWFVGYVPELLALVWVGYDDNRPVRASGAAAALPIWVDLMVRLGIDGSEEFEAPEGIVEAEVDPATGGLATWRCPDVVEEIFVSGTEPTEECPVHGGGARGFWRRLFRMDH